MTMQRTYGDPEKLKGRKRYYSRIYDRATGKRSWVCTGFEKLREAKEWVVTQTMNVALGKDRVAVEVDAERTFDTALEVWMAEKKAKVSEGRHTSYRTQADVWLRVFAGKKLAEISADDIRAYSGRRQRGELTAKKKKKARALSAVSANDDLSALNGFFNFCLTQEWITKSPTVGLQRHSGEIRSRKRSLDPNEESRLLAACRDGEIIEIKARRNLGGRQGGSVSVKETAYKQTVPQPAYLYPLVFTALNSGFRKRTLCSLEWQHADLKRLRWRVPAELLKIKEDYSAPMPQAVADVLSAYRASLITELGLARVKGDAAIFGLEPASSLKRSFSRAVERAELKLSIHDLRRCFLNKCRRAGVGLEEAMRLSAHKDIRTVQKHYRQVDDSELEGAVKALGAGIVVPPAAEPALRETREQA